jgi:carbamoyltransferase
VLICGVKVSHDGSIALIDDGKLAFSIEIEKLENNYRYSPLGRLERITEILEAERIDVADIDRFVLDGWWPESGASSPCVHSTAGGRALEVEVAPYLDAGRRQPCLARYTFEAPDFGLGRFAYSSYHHVTSHLIGCYCSSPFAQRGEDALILVWDGGTVPRLYEVEARHASVRLVAPLLPVPGNVLADFSSHFTPFCADTSEWPPERQLRHHLSIAGKAMAYSAVGRSEPGMFGYLDKLVESLPDISTENAHRLARQIAADRDSQFSELSDADIICTMQEYLGKILLNALADVVSRRFGNRELNLGIAGGCALNIKWNKLIRDSGLFREIWVPPFPNDAGAAIGTASAEMVVRDGLRPLDWQVFCGPDLRATGPSAGWRSRPCDERQLAELLHREGEPVVVLAGRAEIGPRALGNRSVLAPATVPGMKDRLNLIKGREGYRPIAPICLESRAAEIFDPGTPDRYMLFEHRVRDRWADRIPAIVHLDGSARLQTVAPGEGAAGRILSEYAKLSGCPVLCNTSANLNGRGFFPDVASATKWGGTMYVWSDGTLYINPDSAATADAGPLATSAAD